MISRNSHGLGRRQPRPIGIAVCGAVAMLSAAIAQRASADDLATITQRVESQLLAQTPSNSTVQGYMNSLQSNGSWSDISYSSTAITDWSPGTHLTRMEAMAEAYENPSSGSLYHNATLATDLQSAMNYWFSFTSNSSSAPGSADNYGNPTPYSDNWYDNNISGPQALGATMALASSVFTTTEMSEGQNYLANAKKTLPSFTGQNVVDLSIVGVYSAVASQSSSAMSSAFNSMNGTVFVSNFGTDGIQADSSYHIHGIQLYMGGYGTSYINDMLNWASVEAGTGYALNTTQEQTLVNYLLDGTQWFIRGQTMDLTADGRQVSYTSYVGAGDGFVTAIDDALTLGNYRTAELQSFLAREQGTISSGSASTANALVGNRDFYDSDIMVQQRAGWYASAKVDSTRTSDPETGNDQGLKNLYLGDGVNQIMVTGNEYLGIQPTWNWYRLPGTTVEQDGRSLTPSGTFGSVYGTSKYAGGVSDGMYGAEALAYSRFDVQANKSWYFFDNEEVALGSAIKSTSTKYEVDTTLNQCLLTSTVSYETTSGVVQTLTPGTSGLNSVTPANLRWVYQGGVGYFFINPVSDATIEAGPQSGTWYSINTAESSATVTNNVFTLYIDHGTAVNNGSYEYIAVPGISESQMDSYWASDPIQVLSNTATVQAVRQSSLNITQGAFYSAGSFAINSQETVAANAPSTVMLEQQTNSLKLSASSPEAAEIPLNVTLSNINLSGGSTWFDAMGSGVAAFNLPGGNIAGSTVGITLVSDGKTTPTVSMTSNDQLTDSTYTATAAIALPANTTFSEDSFSTLAFSGIVSGNAGITQSGAGTLILSGPNTFTGGLTIDSGTVRALNATAAGSGTTTVNTGADLVVGAAMNSPITLAGGTMNFTGSPTLGGTLTAAASTTSTIQVADPESPGAGVNAPFTGTLAGSGNLVLENATGTTSPDGGQAFRINASNASTFSGTITLLNNTKGELFGTTTGDTTPAGTGTLILTAGDAAYGNTLNTVTTTGGYSELNLRNNTSGNQIYGNNVQIAGSGLAIINPLGTAAAGDSVAMGNLQIGGGQTLGVYLAASFADHPVIFNSVTLTGGTATFAPKPNGFGATTSTGSDLYLGSISESTPGSGITMDGLRTLYLTGNNTYTGLTTVQSGTLQLDKNAQSPVLSGGGANIQGGSLVFDYSNGVADPIAAIQTDLTNSYHAAGGPFTSGQIFSSTAVTGKYGLGFDDNTTTDQVTVMSTLYGDANLDGKVDASDFVLLSNNFGKTGTNWSEGDFNYDGTTDAADFVMLSNNFGQNVTDTAVEYLDASQLASYNQIATDMGFSANQIATWDVKLSGVPEPTSTTLALVGIAAFTSRRRQRLHK